MSKFNELQGKEKTLFFAKTVIEFFENNFGIIHDFILEDSPWDIQLCNILETDIDILRKFKDILLSSIVTTYHNNVLVIPLQKGITHLSSVDESYVRKIEQGYDPYILFVEDNVICSNMIKFFIMVSNVDVKIDTYNYYLVDLNTLNDIYWDTYDKYGISKNFETNSGYMTIQEEIHEQEILVDKLNSFYKEMFINMIQHIQRKFRTKEEGIKFLNYLLSLTYANVYLDKVPGENQLGIEVALQTIVEDGMEFYETFGYNPKFCEVIIDTIFSTLGTKDFDRRNQIKNPRIQNRFKELDEGYGYKYEYPIVMIHDFRIDDALEQILNDIFENCSEEEVYDILCSNGSLYNILYEYKLDARYEDYFRMQLIRKILSDSYESVLFISKQGDEPYARIIKDMNELSKNSKCLFKYFQANYGDFMKIYKEYHNMKDYIIERVRKSAKDDKVIPFLTSISPFSHTHFDYLDNISDEVVYCVDYVNILINRNLKDEEVFEFFYGNDKSEDIEDALKTMCMNVYQNLILDLKKTPQKELLIKILEDNENIVEFLKNNHNILLSIYKLLIHYNRDGICYDEYDYMKSKISNKQYIKTIDRLNPYAKKNNE